MPVYLITLHAYRSWEADNPKGYVQRGERGVKAPDPVLARQRASLARRPLRVFTDELKQSILDDAEEIVVIRNIRLHAITCADSHTHVLVSWFGGEAFFDQSDEPLKQANQLANKIKTILATLLSKREGTTGNRWFSRGCDCTAVKDREHLNHLLRSYLPRHREEGGIVRILDNGNTAP